MAPALKGELFCTLHVRHTFTRRPVIQIMISQTIVGYRTWNIAQKSKEIGTFLFVLGFAITALEWYADFDSRIPLQKGGK